MFAARSIDRRNQFVRVYRVAEDPRGRLYWKPLLVGPVGDWGFRADLPALDYLRSGADILPSQAEELTGLRCPVAFDRIRDDV